ncbi:MAG: Lacal_2735 family protein [Cyclobacteriaceae bacterium]
MSTTSTYQELYSKYKTLLSEAYKLSKSDKLASKNKYDQADQLRQELFAF